ncbi:hypothetical protein QH494_17540 [Sphingomonas sp. AR_OL41]|uniref:hypothetical protein n=1 Tax=Sphingomonas sp. AR_OL41 TaxID=3042729 RepID=UPI00248095C0|nr:hypothetical protein [Sphingomonas sp. AR_OL41]MDH7973994.1 hypothetical protein [Sphingomonas sp. AR_OL41]
MQRTYAETTCIYRHLFKPKDSVGPNAKHRERAAVMISACILQDIDTKHEIINGYWLLG